MDHAVDEWREDDPGREDEDEDPAAWLSNIHGTYSTDAVEVADA